MTIGIKVGNITNEIGTPDFFHAFFSTVSSNLEERWGIRFPVILNRFYQGKLETSLAEKAVSELQQIKEELAAFAPDKVVWDIENLSKQPPWGTNISPEITSLANYFVTSTGRDLISMLIEELKEAAAHSKTAAIVQY